VTLLDGKKPLFHKFFYDLLLLGKEIALVGSGKILKRDSSPGPETEKEGLQLELLDGQGFLPLNRQSPFLNVREVLMEIRVIPPSLPVPEGMG
jgi:hypothetical protein